MATARTRPRASANGARADGPAAKAKEARGAVASAARGARGPLLAAGAAAAGLAGGLAIGSRMASKRRGKGTRALKTAEVLRDGARHLSSTAGQFTHTRDEVRRIREELEKANRRSPLEVVLDGLTHRRGAHKYEG